MNPFSIQCESCSAKLKVARAELIGKRLPCPQCQTIILVPNPNAATSANEPPSDSTAANFGDVDDLLAGLNAPAQPKPTSAKPVRRKSPKTAPKHPDRKAAPPANVAAANPATATTQPWDNPAATAVRQRLTWIALFAGGLLTLFAAGMVWMASNQGSNDQTNESNSDTVTAATATKNKSEIESDITNEVAATPAEPQTIAPSTLTDEVRVADNVNKPTDSIVDSAPPEIDMPMPELPTAPTESNDDQLETVRESSTRSETTTATAANTSGILRPVAAAESSLSELANLLEQSGSSISQITDASSAIDADQVIGLPKYFFRRIEADDIDLTRQLQLPCDGLEYQQTPLIRIIRDINRISGIPITFDFQNFTEPSPTSTLIPVIDAALSNTDMRGAIEQLVSPLGLTIFQSETGIVVRRPDSQTVTTQTHDLTPLDRLGDEGLDGLSQVIQAMIGWDSWFAEADRFKIQGSNRELSVTHLPSVQAQVKSFLDRTAAAIEASEDATASVASPAALRTRLANGAAMRDLPADLPITTRETLSRLLDRIYDQTGVHVLINWETLRPHGWSPQTSVPGNVSEETFDQLLKQLERSLKARALLLDPQTVELTTPADALQRKSVEFYFIADLFEQRFTPERVLQLVQESIAGTPGGRRSLVIYEPKCRSMIVAAPQSTHQVIETVLDRVRKLGDDQP